MPEKIQGPISVSLDLEGLGAVPELTAHIGIIATMWSGLEDELTMLFVMGIQADPAITASSIGEVFSVIVKLNMVKKALALRFPGEAVAPFDPLYRRVKKASRQRNRVVHGLWTVHEDHPDALLRVDGIRDPRLQVEKWRSEDFARVELRLVQLLIDLKLFAQSLRPFLRRGEQEQQENRWRLTSPPKPTTDRQTSREEDPE